MEQVVKEILTPSKKYKAEIIKRADNLFEYCIYEWTREEVPDYGYISEWYWSPLTRTLSLTDTEDKAIRIAIEELHLYSDEVLE